MPRLSKAGRAAATDAAEAFLAQYRSVLLKKGLSPERRPAREEFYVVAFFKHKEKISGYRTTARDDERCGCREATVTLHPHPDWKDTQLKSSQTLNNVPQALEDLRDRCIFPGERFISGHMINANFGGDHTRPGNQTVLTEAANGQHYFDEAVKDALIWMGKAIWEMCRESHAEKAPQYLESLYSAWKVAVSVRVGDETWADIYNAGELKDDDAVTGNQYPLNSVATKIVFRAEAHGTPDINDIAEHLQINPDKMPALANALTEFGQAMDKAALFELYQPAPETFGSRSKVGTKMESRAGVSVHHTVPGTHIPFRPRARGKLAATAKPKKPAPEKVRCYLTYGETSLELEGDTAIDASIPDCPWAGHGSRLGKGVIFSVYTENSGGKAMVSREYGTKNKIVVAGRELKGNASLELGDGETIRVYEPGGRGSRYYELTFEQK